MSRCFFIFIFATIFFSSNVTTAIVENGLIDGHDTFLDETTGLVWLDVDELYGYTQLEMSSLLDSWGYAFATEDQIKELASNVSDWRGYWSWGGNLVTWGYQV